MSDEEKKPMFDPRSAINNAKQTMDMFTIIFFGALGFFSGLFIVLLLRDRVIAAMGIGGLLVATTLAIVYNREYVDNKYYAIAAFIAAFGLFMAIIGDRFL